MSLKILPQKYLKREKKDREIVIIMGIALSSTSVDKVLKAIEQKLEKKEQFSLVTPNPEIILEAQKNKRLKDFINYADFSLPDGVGLSWASKILHGIDLKRIPGRIFFLDLLNLANLKGLKIYFLGADEIVNKKAVEKVIKNYPNINIKGSNGPVLNKRAKPVSLRNRKYYYDTLKHINQFKPDILFVAFGAPKQELYLADNLKGLNIGGAMVIGGALDYFVGKLPTPPKIVSEMGLEWFWRLIHEPKRLIRIFKATVIFPCLVIKEKFTKVRG